jgi:hypothetical protein
MMTIRHLTDWHVPRRERKRPHDFDNELTAFAKMGSPDAELVVVSPLLAGRDKYME